MAEKPETTFRKKVVKALKELPRTYFFSIQQSSLRGSPDLCLSINGNFVALELKKDGDSPPTLLQRHILQKIIGSNGIAFIVYPSNWPEIHSYLRILSCDADTRMT